MDNIKFIVCYSVSHVFLPLIATHDERLCNSTLFIVTFIIATHDEKAL